MKKTKYNNYSKEQLIDKLNKLEKIRYGLVWEDKPEDIADKCEKELPVLVEDKNKEIISDSEKPTHFIFEGDNYHALYTLNFTHQKKIDVIYIDPPYNTGNKDFKYNDSFVDKEDGFRHSKWLSFMSKRLKLAKKLLSDNGVIFISIDDNEQANLKLLCDKIFDEKNFKYCLSVVNSLNGNDNSSGMIETQESCLIYCKNIQTFEVGVLHIDDDEYEHNKWKEDEMGFWKEGGSLKATGINAPKEERPNLFFPIYIDESNLSFSLQNNNKYSYKLLPLTDNKEMSWYWGKEKFIKDSGEVIVKKTKNGYSLYKKQRPALGGLPSKRGKTTFYKPSYSTSHSNKDIKNIFGSRAFDYSKSKDLIKDLILLGNSKNGIILDFFAGSGTTAHAVLELNKQDSGNRQFIVCTNNEVGLESENIFCKKHNITAKELKGWKDENKPKWLNWCEKNGICSTVTYPRIKNVINGYAGNDGIPANVKYFKTDFVPTVLTDNDKRVLVGKSTELICIAENTFNVVRQNKILDYAIFSKFDQHTAIIYDENYIDKCCNELNKIKPKHKTVIYVFSYDHTYNEEDFISLNIDFMVKPIPEAIINIYRKISKLKNK